MAKTISGLACRSGCARKMRQRCGWLTPAVWARRRTDQPPALIKSGTSSAKGRSLLFRPDAIAGSIACSALRSRANSPRRSGRSAMRKLDRRIRRQEPSPPPSHPVLKSHLARDKLYRDEKVLLRLESAIEQVLRPAGRLISASKSGYLRRNPGHEVRFNACLFGEDGTQLWFGGCRPDDRGSKDPRGGYSLGARADPHPRGALPFQGSADPAGVNGLGSDLRAARPIGSRVSFVTFRPWSAAQAQEPTNWIESRERDLGAEQEKVLDQPWVRQLPVELIRELPCEALSNFEARAGRANAESGREDMFLPLFRLVSERIGQLQSAPAAHVRPGTRPHSEKPNARAWPGQP
jgi:hypothetical protein